MSLKKLCPQNINVANSNFYLGCISERRGDYNLAVQCLRDSLSGRQENLDEMDSEIAENLARLGHVYLKKSEFDLAVTVFSMISSPKGSLSILLTNSSPMNPYVSRITKVNADGYS